MAARAVAPWEVEPAIAAEPAAHLAEDAELEARVVPVLSELEARAVPGPAAPYAENRRIHLTSEYPVQLEKLRALDSQAQDPNQVYRVTSTPVRSHKAEHLHTEEDRLQA
ncbi:hypothetical protein ACFPFP_30540 [Bradyrhizobium sp. GCM10023182]|uniref:Uncharacterized protein n=1 Tax=Bradyrhizobium zhengyangense TaxID=2911009 RepID=A0ABS9LW87_9BRAD|nr:hypothetical protein [Bradyrhizobium zhengyangense]